MCFSFCSSRPSICVTSLSSSRPEGSEQHSEAAECRPAQKRKTKAMQKQQQEPMPSPMLTCSCQHANLILLEQQDLLSKLFALDGLQDLWEGKFDLCKISEGLGTFSFAFLDHLCKQTSPSARSMAAVHTGQIEICTIDAIVAGVMSKHGKLHLQLKCASCSTCLVMFCFVKSKSVRPGGSASFAARCSRLSYLLMSRTAESCA